MSEIHLLYIPSASDMAQVPFALILGATPRIVAASIGVAYLVQRLDVILFSWLQRWVRLFGLRVLLSLLVSQAVDTALFSVLGLYGLVEGLFEIILVSYAIKCAIIASSSPLAALLKRFFPQDRVHDIPV